MWAVRGSFISAGCVLSVVSSARPNHQLGIHPSIPHHGALSVCQDPSYPQQGWSPTYQSRNGIYWKAIEQLWLLQGRQDGGQPGMILTDSGAAPKCSDGVCCLPVLCHGCCLQFCNIDVLTLLAREAATMRHGTPSPLAPVMSLWWAPTHNIVLFWAVVVCAMGWAAYVTGALF